MAMLAHGPHYHFISTSPATEITRLNGNLKSRVIKYLLEMQNMILSAFSCKSVFHALHSLHKDPVLRRPVLVVTFIQEADHVHTIG